MRDDDDSDAGSEELGDYVPVIYARSLDEAEKYRQILEDHDIPAVVDEEYEPGDSLPRQRAIEGVPVLVPESLLEDARQFLSEADEMATFGDEEDLYEDEDEDDDFDLEEDFQADEEAAGRGHDREDEEVDDDLEQDPAEGGGG